VPDEELVADELRALSIEPIELLLRLLDSPIAPASSRLRSALLTGPTKTTKSLDTSSVGVGTTRFARPDRRLNRHCKVFVIEPIQTLQTRSEGDEIGGQGVRLGRGRRRTRDAASLDRAQRPCALGR
jgi:hypothetical protein